MEGMARAGRPTELTRLIQEFGPLDARLSYEVLCQAKDACLHRKGQSGLLKSDAHHGVINAMRSHETNADIQTVGCELLGLLAGGAVKASNSGSLMQGRWRRALTRVFTSRWRRVYLRRHSKRSAIFALRQRRIGTGCERKQHAVGLGCFEAVCTGMQNAPESQWVQEAGCIAIGSLCNGTDPDGHYRRTHALTMGAIEPRCE